MKHSRVKNFPAIREIVKDEDEFYIIMDNLEKNMEFVIKGDIDKEEIFKIGRQIIQLTVNLAEKKVFPREIRPVHLFLDKNYTSIKLAHL